MIKLMLFLHLIPHSVTLRWTDALVSLPQPNAITVSSTGITPTLTAPIIGYNVYRGPVSGGPYPNKINPKLIKPGVQKLIDTKVTHLHPYCYVAVSVNNKSQMSVWSNERCVKIP